MPQYPQPNVKKALPTPAQAQQNIQASCIKPIQPPLLHNEHATESIFPTPHSLLPCQPLQRLLQELLITKSLLERLSKFYCSLTQAIHQAPQKIFLPSSQSYPKSILRPSYWPTYPALPTLQNTFYKYHLQAISTGANQNPWIASKHVTYIIS